jgi:polysaccharide export outer membrane protein
MLRFSRFLLSAVAVSALCVAEQPPRDGAAFIEGARKLGLNDEQIRKNMAAAGWDSRIVNDELANSAARRPASPERIAADLPDVYRIGIGDVLQISVWGEPDASVSSTVVRADGNVSIPLVKDIGITDLTPREAEKAIAAKLERYLHGADVTVIVREIHSRKAYIVGAVRTVGQVPLTGRMTVLQAITQAGGLTDYAKRKHIYVLRSENGKQTKLPFNYEAVIKGEGVDQNIVMLPNDTIVVP